MAILGLVSLFALFGGLFGPSARADDSVPDNDYVTESCVTAAKVIRASDGAEGFLTAGHCPLPDDAFLSRYIGGSHDVGIVFRDRLPAPPDDERLVAAKNYDNRQQFGSTSICKVGGPTGNQCGTIATTDYAPTGSGWAEDAYGFMVVEGTICLPGDSGGAWFIQGGIQDGAFWGVTSGGVGGKRAFPAGSCIVSKAWNLIN